MGSFVAGLADTTNPIVMIKNIIIMILIIAVIAGLSYVGYNAVHTYDKGIIAAQVQKDQSAVIANQAATIVNDNKGDVVTNNTEAKVNTNTQKITSAHTKHVTATLAKVQQVQSDTTKPAVEKTKDVSEIYITSLWSQYCVASDNGDESCKNIQPKSADGCNGGGSGCSPATVATDDPGTNPTDVVVTSVVGGHGYVPTSTAFA